MILADRFYLPDHLKAVLWDMDGVLLDTLGLDVLVCNELLEEYFGPQAVLSRSFIRSIFAYHPAEFWRRILQRVTEEFGVTADEKIFQEILEQYTDERNNAIFQPNPGICDILEDIRRSKLKTAVVSNNPTADVVKILTNAGLAEYFDEIVGNDIRDLARKPAPDTYLLGAELLGCRASECAVVEDSLLGAEAGRKAGCFTIGVATGSENFEFLERSGLADQVYSVFEPLQAEFYFGDVRDKNIFTPNEFVSHMLEHIAWRMGCSTRLSWNCNDWYRLGVTIGEKIGELPSETAAAVALGMIDDGSGEVVIARDGEPKLDLQGTGKLDLDWFLGVRCEQMDSGQPLVQLLEGVVVGLQCRLSITICAVEDPHHTWEGVFRGIGIALGKIFQAGRPTACPLVKAPLVKQRLRGDIRVNSLSFDFAEVSRQTAESALVVTVDFSRQKPNRMHFETAARFNPDGLAQLLTTVADAAGFSLQIHFRTKSLSSSHVVLEDTALVLGRALKEIAVLRMEMQGINGAGSSLTVPGDRDRQAIRVGISVEGRKFLKFVLFEDDYDTFRKKFLIGQNVCNGLLSEDLDDFLDGLAGGLGASIMVHIARLIDADQGWQQLFEGLGKALREVFQENSARKGLPPGVKATLA